MANELVSHYNGTPTYGIYAVVRLRSNGYVWNGSALVPFVNTDIANYDVALSSLGGDLFAASMPAALPAASAGDRYLVDYYLLGAATPATTDLRLGGGEFFWSGTAAAIDPGTHFSTTTQDEDQAGPVNLTTYLDKDSSGDADLIAAAREAVKLAVDNEIIAAFRVRLFNGGVTDYATYDLVPGSVVDAVDAAWLAETSTWGVAVKAYQGRGQADDGSSAGPSPDGKMETLYQRYLARLEDIRTGTAILATAAAAGITAEDEFMPVNIGDAVYPQVDADGLPVTASNVRSGYRGFRWDANRGTYRW